MQFAKVIFLPDVHHFGAVQERCPIMDCTQSVWISGLLSLCSMPAPHFRTKRPRKPNIDLKVSTSRVTHRPLLCSCVQKVKGQGHMAT